MTRSKIIFAALAAALFLPTLVNLYGFFSLSDKAEARPVFRLKLGGFDPRDFSRGRYANLRIEWLPDETEPDCVTPQQTKPDPKTGRLYGGQRPRLQCQFCITKTADGATHTAFIPPDEIKKRSCAVVIPRVTVNFQSNGVTNLQAWHNSMMRFYLDERLADRVDAALRNNKHEFSADVSFDDKLKPYPREFYIDDKPYRDFIEGR
jgi:hypothetical protein